ncbi:RagB/SusD family nutrient uptake outer membrane protein [Bacteroides sp. 51]|uniref:RagB/SusD family nutrient uptake outer membrane protein n=1 Tax=Bacteroides sp. 51 TaxID=2302938 RepID=UPI0013D44460|nr:RagB/SusD family nutrient uptake outer membrane protein [Bacteroides sp. 51]NDV82453.1 RagB/SusD family nutrient uptake outer membrane protein [Bacteroides sp. 51]
MKKNFITYISIAFLCVATSSCEDYLNTTPPDKASPDTFLKDMEQAQSLLAGVYNCFYDEGAGYINPYTYENMSDNSYNPNTWEYSAEFAKGTQTASSHLAEYKWRKDWQAISRANSLLRGLAINSSLTGVEKNKLTAESRFLRAYFYFDLVSFYGRVPLLDENSPLEDPAREELSKVLTFIHEDIDFAIEHLPHAFGGESANKGAAYMLKMRVAQYEYDHATVIASAKAIKALGYSLYDNFTNLFLEKGIDDASNHEVIFKVNYATDLRSSGMTMLWYHWASFQTLLPVVESFFTANGLPIKDIDIDGGGSILKDPMYDPDHPFLNRDPRLHLSILCPGYEYRLDAQSRYQANWVPASWGNNTGFRPKKGADVELANTNNDGTDKIYMRYGEVLLAWAESENELNGPAGAYPLIDELRNRVGMITLSASLPNLNKNTMRELIRNERRVELFNEGQRWHDIRRWKIAEKVMVDGVGLDVTKMKTYTNGNVSDTWQYVPMVIDRRSFNKDRDYLWPIPQKEINANKQMEGDQNPGY